MTNRRTSSGGIVITGAGAGLGRAYAVHLADLGYGVVLNDINDAALENVVHQVSSSGGRVVGVPGSITDADLVDRLIATAVGRFENIEALICNAGVGVAGRLTALADKDIQRVLDVHVLGTIWSVRAALKEMDSAGYGRIVITSSGVGAFGLERMSVYSAAKAALLGLTRSLALDLKGTDLRVNAIAPVADTAMSDWFFRRYPHLDRSRYTTEAILPVVTYLCSRQCRLHGAILSVGAGQIGRIATVTSIMPTNGQIALESLQAVTANAHTFEPRHAVDELDFIAAHFDPPSTVETVDERGKAVSQFDGD